MKQTWNIYKAEQVYTRNEDGNYYPNTLSLEKIAENLKEFSTDCWPIIEKTKKELVAAGAWEGCLSRSATWCEDILTRYATPEDKVRDDMFPSLIGIQIIATPYTLSLSPLKK